MPAWSAEHTIGRTLHSLVQNAPDVERIVVVDSGPSRAAAVACGFAGVDVVALGRRASAGRARNVGRERAAAAELLLFVDADCALAPGSVHAMIEALSARGLVAAGAAIAPEGGGAVGWVRHLLEFKEADPASAPRAARFLPSAALLVRARDFDAAGGFPDMWPGEDLVLCARLGAGGGRMEKVEGALAHHIHPGSLVAFLRHQLRLGSTAARARTMCDMPGSLFVGRPWLVPVLWAGRFTRTAAWLLRHRRDALVRFVYLLPLFAAGLSAWTLGFATGESRSGGSPWR